MSNYKIIQAAEIRVIGIAIRTTNEQDQYATDIPALWKKFHNENLMEQIPNKINNDILALYIDYEKDDTKPYSCLICAKVDSFDNVPIGMVSKTIPAASYAVYRATGVFPDNVIDTWQQIWQSEIHRTYSADFEIYTDSAKEQNYAEIDIYIAIKP